MGEYMSKWRTWLGFPEMRGNSGFLLILIIDALGSGLFVPLSILYFQVTAGFSLAAIGLLLTIATLYTLASLCYTPTASSLVAEIGPTALRGRYLATYEFSRGVANALTPALFTVLFAIRPNLPWLVLATLTSISGLTMLLLKHRIPEREIRP